MAITYITFVEQLKNLVTQAENFKSSELNADSEVFKDWKLEATELVWSVERLGFQVNSAIAQRLFTVRELYSSVSESMKDEKFNEDFSNTLREFRLILKNYERNGLPHKVRNFNAQEERSPLEVKSPSSLDERVTVDWLIKNIPFSWWMSALGAVFFLLGIGFTAGRLYESDFLSIKTLISECIRKAKN